MPRFAPGNRYAARPKMTPEELLRFQVELRAFRTSLNYSPRELEEALGYESRGKLVRALEGCFPTPRQPSREFVWRLGEFKAVGPIPKPPWAPALVYDPQAAAVPLERIKAEARRCLECAAETLEGRRPEAGSWYWFGHPRARFCSRQHRRAWRRRAAWFAACGQCPRLREAPVSLDQDGDVAALARWCHGHGDCPREPRTHVGHPARAGEGGADA